MRRRLIPVLILAETFPPGVVTAHLCHPRVTTVHPVSIRKSRRVVLVKEWGSAGPSTVFASPSRTHILDWLAMAQTPGVAPTQARKLVEFGGAEAFLHASLAELESNRDTG
jgi:hypothetical protein